MNTVWNLWKGLVRLNRDDLLLLLKALGGIFLLIHIITALAVKFSGEGSALMLSGVLLPIVAAVTLVLLTSIHVLYTFVQAIKFGQTRKRALTLTLGLVGFELLAATLLTCVLNALERAFAPGFWKWIYGAKMVSIGPESAVPIPEGLGYYRAHEDFLMIEVFSIGWRAPFLIILAGAVIGFILGALIQRYGQKGGWFVWGLWMIFFLLFPRLPWRTHEVTNVLIPVLCVLAVLALLWSVWSLLRAVVKA